MDDAREWFYGGSTRNKIANKGAFATTIAFISTTKEDDLCFYREHKTVESTQVATSFNMVSDLKGFTELRASFSLVTDIITN